MEEDVTTQQTEEEAMLPTDGDRGLFFYLALLLIGSALVFLFALNLLGPLSLAS